MRNISQTIFNIDKMEKIIKTLPELKSIIDANKFHTFDYTEGLSVSDGIEIFEIANEENDEDMISQYSDTLESLEKYESDHRETELFSGLYISETINKL